MKSLAGVEWEASKKSNNRRSTVSSDYNDFLPSNQVSFLQLLMGIMSYPPKTNAKKFLLIIII
jgi:hypothetical protein